MPTSAFHVCTLVATAAGAAAGTAVLATAARRGRVGAVAVLGAGVLMGVIAPGACVVGAGAGILTVFGAIRLLYVAGVVALPLVAAGFLASCAVGRVRATRAAAVLGVLGLLPAGIGAWASFVEPRRLCVERATLELPRAREGVEPVRLGILADLQCDEVGEYENAAVDRLLAEEPDVILVPGDLFHASAEEWDRWTAGAP